MTFHIGQRVVYYAPPGCPDHQPGAKGQCPGCGRQVAKCGRWAREHVVAVTYVSRQRTCIWIEWPLGPGETTPHSTITTPDRLRPVALVRRETE